MRAAAAVAVTFVLLAGVALPLAAPLGGLGGAAERLGGLARNTAAVVLLVQLLAAPTGVLLAVLLERTDLPGRRIAWALLILSLFLPLPLIVSGWQGVLGAGG